MDPFEIRLQFTRMLQKLNASVNASRNCATFALKHKELDEDLHSCILEQLERSSMNNRVNLLYFIEHLLDASLAKNCPNYIQMIQADFPTIVNSVTPADPSGLQNIGAVRKVILKVRDKNFITADLYSDLVQTLDERESSLGIRSTNGAHEEPKYDEAVISGRKRSRSPVDHSPLKSTGPTTVSSVEKLQPQQQQQLRRKRDDEKAIEQRMEEDRERHKRLRENIWAIMPAVDINGVTISSNYGLEFEMSWDDVVEKDMNEDDIEEMVEEADIKVQSRL